MTRAREILINAFYMASPAQSWAGLWTHPASNGLRYTEMEFWLETARLAERGLIDAVFLADILGAADVYGGVPDAVLKAGCMMPNNDPMMVVPAMAAVTSELCFGITGNTTYEPPYLLARRFSTLDHLTRGRVAWNIVTGILPSTFKAMGMRNTMAHDARYDAADEYMDLMYALWEQSWEESAAVRDVERRIFADPAKVHKIRFAGQHYACEGIHLAEPSPQRTPLLYAAGASGRGRVFAGKHAEATFMSTCDLEFAKRTAKSYRDEAERQGRDRRTLRVFNAATVIVAPTEAEARELAVEYQNYSDAEGNLAIFSSWLGIDLAKYAPDDPIEYIESNAIQSIVEAMTRGGGDRRWTVRDLAKFGPVGGREAYIIGDPQQVCDQLIHWVDYADIDGFNLVRTVEPGGLRAFVDLVVPELQSRGAYKTAYRPGTMREKFFPGNGDRLPIDHHGRSDRETVPSDAAGNGSA
ncbi:MAG TPA: LLM class flavin-dependent oxidoreductase [Sphingobium sp.]|uniref:LLM class flavin-dependent oxidoreductase n=1 Tax=Sphingobium sp. TaxID=1912891 RepID=UPI002ED47170